MSLPAAASELVAWGFLGVGGTLLGLATLKSDGAFLRSRWTLAGPAALVLLAAVGAGLGRTRTLCLPPLTLAVIWSLGHAASSPVLDWVGGVLTHFRQPQHAGMALLLASGALVVALLRGTCPTPAGGAAGALEWSTPAEHYGLREVAVGRVTTDRGRPLHVLACTRPGAPGVPGSAVQYHLFRAELLCLSPPNGECNCHGWIFLGGHYWLEDRDVEVVLQDNGYQAIAEPHAGDLTLYRDAAGGIQHSGVVVAVTDSGVLVESKWGDQGLFVHWAELPGYGRHTYYHSTRPGHLLRGLDGRAAAPRSY
jgi:hypothetical protein